MGLFGKQKASAAELAALQGDVGTLRERLDLAEQARDALARQLAEVSAGTTASRASMEGRLDEVNRRFECIVPLGRRIDEIGGRLEAAIDERESLHAELSSEIARRDQQRTMVLGRLDQLAGRIDAVPDHLGRLEHLEQRLDTLPDPHERVDAVHRRIDLLPDHTDWLNDLQGRLDKVPDHSPAIDELAARVDGLAATASRVDEAHARLDELAGHAGRLEHLQRCVDGLPDHTTDLAAHASRLDELAARVDAVPDDHSGRLGALDQQISQLTAEAESRRQLAQSLALLDARMVAAARRIDEQLAALAADLETVSARPAPVTPEQLDELRTGQARLANEQTRFQISLREDVAVVAEQVRRLTTR